MNFSASALISGFIFGVIGMYVFKNAKSDGNLPNLLIGLALMLYPYFIESALLLWGIGFALSALAYKLKDSY